MNQSTNVCGLNTMRNKTWTYEQFYVGKTDEEKRRSGRGENHWTGAESLEWYNGEFVQNTMHGVGSYYWRHRGVEDVAATYEGYLYCNRIHGYGTMSYNDGRTFSGLFYDNMKWGPGVESYADMHENVGLWRGNQLIRLSWKPATPSLTPDFMVSNNGLAVVESYRTKLKAQKTYILKEQASAPLEQLETNSETTTQKFSKLIPKHCTDLNSSLFAVKIFDQNYYKNILNTLEDIDDKKMEEDLVHSEKPNEAPLYYVWNNSDIIISMMKHSFTHDAQRKAFGIDLQTIISGSRKQYKIPGKHEIHCRTLLMACYLGRGAVVAQLLNDHNVNPNVADAQGNTPIMYAMCGDQSEIIDILVEAGAHVDRPNDSCCTPLGVALMRLVCAQKNIPPSGIQQAVLPPPKSPSIIEEQNIIEWKIKRNTSTFNTADLLTKISLIKMTRNNSVRRVKSSQTMKDGKGKALSKITKLNTNLFDNSFDYNLYCTITTDYTSKLMNAFSSSNNNMTIPYVFEINNIIDQIETTEEEYKRTSDKDVKKLPSKIINIQIMNNTIKESKEIIWKETESETPVDAADKHKADILAKILNTILQLLSKGASVRLVKCPQKALMMAVTSSCSQLIRHLVQYGADVNEELDQSLRYSPLDVAISLPFNEDNLEVIRALLECGADTNHTLRYTFKDQECTGPNLLHAALLRRIENSQEDEIQRQLVELLLEYNCSPTVQFKGQSAIDMAMNKNIDLLNTFLRCPKTNPNSIINNFNQSILVKMFSLPYFKNLSNATCFQMLTHLLAFGADPFIVCYDGDVTYENSFVFARKMLNEMQSGHAKPNSTEKQDANVRKLEKPKKDDKLFMKSTGKMAVENIEDYIQAVDIVNECARLLMIRWLQAKLVKDLIRIIHKFVHRHWSMIVKECNDQECMGLWLTPLRCVEIWGTLKYAGKKECNVKTLRDTLCLVIYFKMNAGRNKNIKITAAINTKIESEAGFWLDQGKTNKVDSQSQDWKLVYAKPELAKNDNKFKFICFECFLPLPENKIVCSFCKKISFCTSLCMKLNIERPNCHPCSDFLQAKYFSESIIDTIQITPNINNY